MEITEVRIKLMEDSDDRLQAFCSITFDNAFVVRDLKIIDGTNGPFVAMPSRKLTAHCPNCRVKNHLRSSYCNNCGMRLRDERPPRDADGRVKLYADIAHPINAACREQIQKRVIAEFLAELDRATEPGYVSRYDDEYDVDFEDEVDTGDAPPREVVARDVPRHAPELRPASPPPTPTRPPERTVITQPAATEPRPPHHTTPAVAPAKTPAQRGGPQFGAGVFD